MYRCQDCKRSFARPRNVSDDIGDEDYDICPKCGSDNFEEQANKEHENFNTTKKNEHKSKH